MTYIWNRAERVHPKLMPHAVEDAFNKWTKEQLKGFNNLNNEAKVKLTYKIAVQLGKKNYALTQLGYYK